MSKVDSKNNSLYSHVQVRLINELFSVVTKEINSASQDDWNYFNWAFRNITGRDLLIGDALGWPEGHVYYDQRIKPYRGIGSVNQETAKDIKGQMNIILE